MNFHHDTKGANTPLHHSHRDTSALNTPSISVHFEQTGAGTNSSRTHLRQNPEIFAIRESGRESLGEKLRLLEQELTGTLQKEPCPFLDREHIKDA